VKFCFYRLTQSTWWKIQEIGLAATDNNFRDTRVMLDGLAFLPTNDTPAYDCTSFVLIEK